MRTRVGESLHSLSSFAVSRATLSRRGRLGLSSSAHHLLGSRHYERRNGLVELIGGFIINSAHCFSIARDAADRALRSSPSDRSHCSSDPLVAVVFATAAIDAFANELGELARVHIGQSEPPVVANLAALLGDAESGKASTALKFQLARIVLAGVGFDRGSSPYQDFALLLDLRNDLVHMKFERVWPSPPDNLRMEYPEIVKRLRSKNVIAELEPPEALASWVAMVSTPATARWACNAATRIVRDIIALVPASSLRRSIDAYYRFGFEEMA